MRRDFSWMFLLALGAIVFWRRDDIVTAVAGWKASLNASKYLPALHAAEARYGIPTDLLARMAYQESHFRDDIVSGAKKSAAGAAGIMQIVPQYHPGVDPLNVSAAIDYAGKYLRQLYAQFGSWQLAVAAYNAGPGNVQKYGGIPPFQETKDYVAQIFRDIGVNV